MEAERRIHLSKSCLDDLPHLTRFIWTHMRHHRDSLDLTMALSHQHHAWVSRFFYLRYSGRKNCAALSLLSTASKARNQSRIHEWNLQSDPIQEDICILPCVWSVICRNSLGVCIITLRDSRGRENAPLSPLSCLFCLLSALRKAAALSTRATLLLPPCRSCWGHWCMSRSVGLTHQENTALTFLGQTRNQEMCCFFHLEK